MKRLDLSEAIFKVISYTLVGLFALSTLYPFIYIISVSISGKVAVEAGEIILVPKDIQFKAFKAVIYNKDFWISYSNTLFYTFFGTIWSMFVSITAAYALSKKRLLFNRQLNFLVVFTMWFNAGLWPTYINYIQLGIVTKWGIVIAFGVQAFYLILLRNYFSSVPTEIEESAKIDGGNEFQILAYIYVPMSKAAIATVTLFYGLARWNGYFWTQWLLKDIYDYPLQVYIQKTYTDLTAAAAIDGTNLLPYAIDSFAYALIICSIIPIVLVYPFLQKYFAKGVNVGGVKG